MQQEDFYLLKARHQHGMEWGARGRRDELVAIFQGSTIFSAGVRESRGRDQPRTHQQPVLLGDA